MKTSKILAAVAAVATLTTAGSALAAPQNPVVTSVTTKCVVAKSGKAKAATTVTIAGSQIAPAFLSGTGCQSPMTIVQKIARTGIQRPFTSGLYTCTPSISGSTGKWTCVFQAADTASKLTIRFTYRY